MKTKILFKLLFSFLFLQIVILPNTLDSKNPISKVYIGLALSVIDNISIKDQSFYAEFYLNMHWSKGSRSPLNFEFFTAKEITKSFEISWEDTLWNYFSCKVKGNFRTKMDVESFPFDTHDLTVELCDNYWLNDSLVYIKYEEYTGFSDKFHLNDWKLIGYETDTSTTNFYQNNFSSLNYTISIQRDYKSALYKVFVPILIILGISLLNLFIPLDDFPTRINLSITTILSFVALHFTITSQFPELKYPTNIDTIMVAIFILIFVGLIKITFINRLVIQDKIEYAAKLDNLSIIIIPVIYLVTLLSLFLYLYF